MPRPHTNSSALRRILQQELLVGRRMVALAEEESEALIAGDVPRLTPLLIEHQQTLEQQEVLETARQSATRELAWACGQERATTLLDLLPALPAREQDALSQLRVQLLETHGQLEVLNRRNRDLLETSLDIVRYSLDALTSAALQPARYGTNIARIAAPAFYIDSKA